MIVGKLINDDEVQLSLFDQLTNRDRYMKISKVIDKINGSMGRDKLRIATQGFDRKWKMKQEDKKNIFMKKQVQEYRIEL